ncbi:MAG TPA: 1-deoxy-D-xylulose-5-phosphate reductoisomerase [Actinomycetota bacterium]|nr:1-deoxy-D-xylulose-5-phosphate reductoisomerase [Actinomycetota bacterium]
MTHHGLMDLFDTPERLRVAILGSTGSIGSQALEVVRAYPERFEVVALAANSDTGGLLAQAKEFEVSLLGIVCGPLDAPDGCTVFEGEHSAERVVQESDAHLVLNAVVGAAGLRATMATILAGKTLALANKESLVAGGELVMSKVMEGQLRPVDSEHSSLWQLLEGLPPHRVRRVLLTGSGGPFRGKSLSDLKKVTVEGALNHPVWEMGPKITIDSSTLMNKGLEVIEAHFLFGLTYDEIQVVIHPQGMVHGMVETMDGSVFAHAAPPDMRLPIQLAMAFPDRLGAPADRLSGVGARIDWTAPQSMTFEPPDLEAFRCLALAFDAGRQAGTYPAVLNAANETAVEAFLAGKLDYLGIPAVVEDVLGRHESCEPSLEAILEQDAWARSQAATIIDSRSTI